MIFTKSLEANIPKFYILKVLYYLHFIAAVLVPFFTEWGKISFQEILILNACFMFFMFILEVPTGTVADYFGRKQSMMLGFIINIIAVFVYLSYPSFWVFILGEFLWAMSATLMSGADDAILYDTLLELGKEKESKKYFGHAESYIRTGILLGALGGGFIAKYFGVKAPVLAMAIPFAIAFFISFSIKEPTIHKVNTKDKKSYFDLLKGGLVFYKNHKILKILTLDMVTIGSLSWIILWFYQKLLMGNNIDIYYFGIVHAFICIGQIIIIQSSNKLEKLLGNKKNLLLMGSIIPGICFIILGIFKSNYIMIPAIITAANFGLSRKPLFANYMNKFIPSDKRATVLSVISMFRTLAICIANLTAAAISSYSIHLTLIIFGSILIIFPIITKIEEDHLID